MSGEPDDFEVPDYEPGRRKGNAPDFILRATPRSDFQPGKGYQGRWVTVGAGWEAANGSISIELDTAVALRWDDGLKLYLVPNAFKDDTRQGRKR